MNDSHDRLANYITVTDAAERIGHSPALIRRYCQTGRIPAIKLGMQWLIWPDDLDNFERTPRHVGRPKKA